MSAFRRRPEGALAGCSARPRNLRWRTTFGRPPPAVPPLLSRVVSDRIGELAAADSIQLRGCGFSPRACANSRQGWRAAGSQLLGCTTPSRLLPRLAATIGRGRGLEPGSGGAGGARPQSGPHPAGRWRKVLAAGPAAGFHPIPSAPAVAILSRLWALLARWRQTWRRGPPPTLHPHPGASGRRIWRGLASQALRAELPGGAGKGAEESGQTWVQLRRAPKSDAWPAWLRRRPRQAGGLQAMPPGLNYGTPAATLPGEAGTPGSARPALRHPQSPSGPGPRPRR